MKNGEKDRSGKGFRVGSSEKAQKGPQQQAVDEMHCNTEGIKHSRCVTPNALKQKEDQEGRHSKIKGRLVEQKEDVGFEVFDVFEEHIVIGNEVVVERGRKGSQSSSRQDRNLPTRQFERQALSVKTHQMNLKRRIPNQHIRSSVHPSRNRLILVWP